MEIWWINCNYNSIIIQSNGNRWDHKQFVIHCLAYYYGYIWNDIYIWICLRMTDINGWWIHNNIPNITWIQYTNGTITITKLRCYYRCEFRTIICYWLYLNGNCDNIFCALVCRSNLNLLHANRFICMLTIFI